MQQPVTVRRRRPFPGHRRSVSAPQYFWKSIKRESNSTLNFYDPVKKSDPSSKKQIRTSGYNRVQTKKLFMKHDRPGEDVQHVQGDKGIKSSLIVGNSLPQEKVKDKLNFMSATIAESSDILALNNIPSIKDGVAKISKELELAERWDMVRIIYSKQNRVRSLVFKVSKPKLKKDLDLLTQCAQSKLKSSKIQVEFATKAQINELNEVKKRNRKREKKKSRRKHRRGARSLCSMSAKSLASLKVTAIQRPEKKSENTTPDGEFDSRGSSSSVYSHTSTSPRQRNRDESGKKRQRSYSFQPKSVQSMSPFDNQNERKRSSSINSQPVPPRSSPSLHPQSVQSMSPFDGHREFGFFPPAMPPRGHPGYGPSYHFYETYGVGRSPTGSQGYRNCVTPKQPGKEQLFLRNSANMSPKYLVNQGQPAAPNNSPRHRVVKQMSPTIPLFNFHPHPHPQARARSLSERSSIPQLNWLQWSTQFQPSNRALEGGHMLMTGPAQHHRTNSANGRMIRMQNMSMKPIKCLFLDVKGTLTTTKGSCKLPRSLLDLRPNLAKKLLLLKLVIYLTRCKLILTGGAKRNPALVGFINLIFTKWGIEPFYAITASFTQENASPNVHRMKEIRYWLDMNPVESWCVLDALDLSGLNEGKRKRFVLVDPRVGLTRSNNKSILEILGVESDLY